MSRFTKPRIKQALGEALLMGATLFGISFLGWVSGLSTLPDLEAAEAAARAALLAGSGGIAKGLLFFLTGTVVVPDGAGDPGDPKVAVRLPVPDPGEKRPPRGPFD